MLILHHYLLYKRMLLKKKVVYNKLIRLDLDQEDSET